MAEKADIRYLPIFLESVLVNTVIAFDLFIYNREKGGYILYKGKDTKFTEKNRLRLVENNVPALFISNEELDQYQSYIEENLGNIVESENIKKEEKANIIYQSARNMMENIMAKPLADNTIQRSKRFVKNTVRYILKEKDYFMDIINLTSHDYYTFTHSINVCIYSLSLARRLGIDSQVELNTLGTGALLHDIGKSTIPREILLKKGKLDNDEWKIIKEHPERGVELVKKSQAATGDMLDIVRHHHEKLDGTGYPYGLKGTDIPSYAKLVCICDIFDALNTNRPYKQAADTFHSLEIMNDQFPGKLDKHMFREFILLFSKK